MKNRLIMTAIFGLVVAIPGSALAERSMSTIGGKSRVLDYSSVIKTRTAHQRCRSTVCGPSTTSSRTVAGERPQAERADETKQKGSWFRDRCFATACPRK